MAFERDEHGLFDLLEIAKKTSLNAVAKLDQIRREQDLDYQFDSVLKREMKAKADRIIESAILEDLSKTGIPILSEEAHESYDDSDLGRRFIVDPIDGTVNFIRGVGLSSVSIALYDDDQPLFGVLAIYPGAEIVWGGPGIGSFHDGVTIKVSEQTEKVESILCTGIPARLDLTEKGQKEKFLKNITEFAKVRMMGAASISLFNVAKGSADCYAEQDVMIWDIAAGLAILLGAGGQYELAKGNYQHSWNVVGHNGKLFFKPS